MLLQEQCTKKTHPKILVEIKYKILISKGKINLLVTKYQLVAQLLVCASCVSYVVSVPSIEILNCAVTTRISGSHDNYANSVET